MYERAEAYPTNSDHQRGRSRSANRSLCVPEADGTQRGHVFNGLRLLANHPRQATLLMKFAQSVRYESTLDQTLAELAYLTASTVNCCHY